MEMKKTHSISREVKVKVVRLIAAIYDIAILHSSKHALQVITKNVQYVKI